MFKKCRGPIAVDGSASPIQTDEKREYSGLAVDHPWWRRSTVPVSHPRMQRRMEEARPKLFRTALAWCGNRDLAEDLAQEALTRALIKCGQLRSMDALEAWLFRIMANLWRDHVRRDRPMATMEDVDARTEETPEDLNAQQQMVARVRAAIQALPGNYRMVLALVDIEGFSYAETAAILNVPVGTVMSRLSRARTKLGELLGPAVGREPPVQAVSRFRKLK